MREHYPDDFKIEVSTGGLMPGSVQHVLEIDASGKGRYAQYYSDEPGDALTDMAFTLTKIQLETLWQTILEQGFFSLEAQYVDEEVDDGAFASLTVAGEGKSHRVDVENTSVSAIEAILKTINQVTPSEIELPYVIAPSPD